jgi:hypothetical protein
MLATITEQHTGVSHKQTSAVNSKNNDTTVRRLTKLKHRAARVEQPWNVILQHNIEAGTQTALYVLFKYICCEYDTTVSLITLHCI